MSDTPAPADLEKARLLLWTMTFGQPAARAAVDVLFTASRQGAEALETLKKMERWCREFNIRLFDAPSTGDTRFWCHAESNEGRHRSNCPKTIVLALIHGAPLAPTREGRS